MGIRRHFQSEWGPWLESLKMEIMDSNNLEVHEPVKVKLSIVYFFYPTFPIYKDPFEGRTEDEERQRQQRKKRRWLDWENECNQIEQRGLMVGVHWYEADLKVNYSTHLLVNKTQNLINSSSSGPCSSQTNLSKPSTAANKNLGCFANSRI